MKTVYYAHCKAIYNTLQEARDIETLNALGLLVINPNQIIHQERCKNHPRGEMGYFYEMVRSCDVFAFRALLNQDIAAGVGGELTTALAEGKPIIELPTFTGRRTQTVDETRQYLKECGQR